MQFPPVLTRQFPKESSNNMSIHTKHPGGFSFVELITVVVIIGIITTIIIVSFTAARIKARDAQRVHNIQEIRTVLELYYNRTKTYPTNVTPGQTFANNGIVYIDPLPTNPSPRTDGTCTDSDYAYAPQANLMDYNLVFCLGAASNGLVAGDNICNASSCGAPTGGYSAEAQLLFARFTGTLSSTNKNNMNTLINSAKTHGWWGKLDAFYVFAIGTNAADALLNWKSSSFTATNMNSMSWVADRGFTSNGSSSYLDLGFDPSLQTVNFQRNSASYAVYVRTNSEGIMADLGAFNNSGTGNEFFSDFPGVGLYATLNGGGSDWAIANTNSSGLWVASRTSSTSETLYRNGTLYGNASVASKALPNLSFYVGASHRNTGTSYYSTRQIAAVALGAGLTTAEMVNFSSDLNTYMTAIGANTY